ncbi:hypothetical protein T230_15015 [Tannerella sp. oral taxon BU063 isolate Cell 1/3]|uniref:Uncharacterized protein n=1 Tax=Tannerella sp. oral taxon BU063 isolate Cell 1/3 TaxID=1411022 RepID=W2CFW8_9BACT|nr:hypothetical protein T230_15015 [Tannerella sp. oral taxon BU063 isolate Cell 1/3]
MEEKKQKKIKASAEAGEACRVPGQTSLAAAAAPLPRPGKFGPGTRTNLAGGRSRPATEAGEVSRDQDKPCWRPQPPLYRGRGSLGRVLLFLDDN